jgi:chromosome segregation ATPase
MWTLLFLIIILGVTLAVLFISAKKYKTKIESLEEKILDKKQEEEHLQSKGNHHDEVVNELKVKNKKLKTTSKDNQKLIKENQQLRNQLSELEEKNKLIQENKIELQKQREKFKKKIEKEEEMCSQLKKENKELKSNFLQNEKIKSYTTILKEALLLQTFLNDDTKRQIQILHDFPELSEETIRNYLSHLCDINLLTQVDDDTYQRNFSMEKDDHVLDKILCKIFDCDLQKFRKLLQ